MEHPLPPHAGRAGDDSLDVRFGTLGSGERRRIRFRVGSGDRARTVSFYALSDSGRRRRSVAYADVLALPRIAGAAEAGALDLLGPRCGVRAQRADQGTDRAGVSGSSDRALSVADREFAALAETAAGFEHSRLFRDRGALAHFGGVAKPGAGPGARISVVLFRQRAHPALPEQAHAARLRHGAPAAVLGVAGVVADSVDSVPSTVAAGTAVSVARVSRAHGSAPARPFYGPLVANRACRPPPPLHTARRLQD